MITIFICTYNRGFLIDATLQSIIEEQTLLPDEIVVVNGGGQNDCAETLAKWKVKFPQLREIKTVNVNLATSRNVGLPECQGDIVLQTDDDARPFADWVEKMKLAHEQYPDAGVIGGEVVDASGDSFLSAIADVTTFPRYTDVREVRTVPGVNSSYKKKVIEQLGMYDVTLARGEDVDYNWRAKLADWKVLYIPDIIVYHVHRATWKGLFNQHYMYGKSYYLVRKKWPDMYCVYPKKISSVKDLLKVIYFLLTPFIQSWEKVRKTSLPLYQRLVAFFVIALIYYRWMKGVLDSKKG